MIQYLLLPFHFDVTRMQEETNAAAESQWKQHYQTLHYTGSWSGIPLRSSTGKADDLYISPHAGSEYRDTVFLKQSPYLQEVLSVFKCPLKAVRLLKLDAGAVIKEHRDADLCFEQGGVRLHIPVVTHDDVLFYTDKERLIMREGECWYVNFNLPHSIQNNSKTDRVHLVIDAVVNDWVTQLFNGPEVMFKKEKEEESFYNNDDKKEVIKNLRAMNTATSNQLADSLEKELGG
jgi:hypothetical protein